MSPQPQTDLDFVFDALFVGVDIDPDTIRRACQANPYLADIHWQFFRTAYYVHPQYQQAFRLLDAALTCPIGG